MNTQGLLKDLPDTGNISLVLLKERAANNKPEAIRELGRYILKYAESHEHLTKGRLMLLAAAHMADRGASWLLTLYYSTGKYGFDKNSELAEHWKHRTEYRLRSDASLIYDDEDLKEQAVQRYTLWQSQWN